MTAKSLLPFLALGALSLAACSPMAAPPQPVGVAAASPEDRLVAAIEAEGCTLSSGNVGAVLLRANLVQADLPGLTASLASQGRIEAADGSTIRVLSSTCV